MQVEGKGAVVSVCMLEGGLQAEHKLGGGGVLWGRFWLDF